MTSSSNRISALPLVLCLMGAMYDIPLTLPGLAIPSLIPVIVLLFIPRVRPFIATCTPYVLAWFLMVGISEFFSPSNITGNVGKFAIQSTFSIFCSVAAYFIVRGYDGARLYRAATLLLLTLIALGVLERFTPAGDLFQEAGKSIYSASSGFRFASAEQSLERDLALAGYQRATLLMAEPSLAAVAIVFLIALRCMVSARKSAIGNLCLLAAAYFLIRSPFLVLGLAFQVLFSGDPHKGSFKRWAWALIASAALPFVAYPLFQARLQNFDLSYSYLTSEVLRFILPWNIFSQVMAEGFWLGIGPSGIYDPDLIAILSGGYTDNIGTNALLAFFICFGPFLPAFFFFMLIASHQRFLRDVQRSIPFIIFAIFISITVGAFMAPKIWLIFGIAAATVQLNRPVTVASTKGPRIQPA